MCILRFVVHTCSSNYFIKYPLDSRKLKTSAKLQLENFIVSGCPVVRALYRHRKGVDSVPVGRNIIDEFFQLFLA